MTNGELFIKGSEKPLYIGKLKATPIIDNKELLKAKQLDTFEIDFSISGFVQRIVRDISTQKEDFFKKNLNELGFELDFVLGNKELFSVELWHGIATYTYRGIGFLSVSEHDEDVCEDGKYYVRTNYIKHHTKKEIDRMVDE